MNAVPSQQTLTRVSTLFQWMRDAGKSERELPFSYIEAIRHYLGYEAEFDDDDHGLDTDVLQLPKLETLDDIFLDDNDTPMLSLVVKGCGQKRHPVPWLPEFQDEYYRYHAAMDRLTIFGCMLAHGELLS